MEEKHPVVKVSPIFHPWYYEYYYKGLVDFYGEKNVAISYEKRFLSFQKFTTTKFNKAFFYYEVEISNQTKKVVISAEDWTDINMEVYQDVDIYALVNVYKEQLEEHSKLFAIGPNFGIRYFSIWNYLKISWNLKMKAGITNPHLKAFKNNTLKRSFYNEFEKKDIKEIPDYTFYLNFPWKKHSDVTDKRTKIIQILKDLVKNNEISFEGGFAKRRLGYHDGLKELSAQKTYNHSSYLNGVKKSSFVINTPAVHGCLGWKLGEYLALGKPIISLPLNRAMPGNFKKNVHYLEIDSIEKDLKSAILSIRENKDLSISLAKNASDYYQEYLKPSSVIKRIHTNIFSS